MSINKEPKYSVVTDSDTRRFISETLNISPYLLRRLRTLEEAQSDMRRARMFRERVAAADNVICMDTFISAALKKKMEKRRSSALLFAS